MTTRFNAKSSTKFGVPGLPSGYGGVSTPVLTVPSVGIEDVDVALFNLFDKDIPLHVSTSNKNLAETKKVPIIFGSSEKWAMSKRDRTLRDRNGTLIIPLITIVRTNVQQTPNEDIAGRGINQQTGEIVIKRRLDRTDRAYQRLINRLSVLHQPSLAVPAAMADSGQLTTTRAIGDMTDDVNVEDGGLLIPDRKNNVFETIVIPAPQFFTATYDVTMWAQYTIQMNQLIEKLIASFLPQGNAWRLDTQKGYWFLASVDGNVYNPDNNFDDMSQEERTIKYKFTVKVPGYILASTVPGAPVPVKRYLSSPEVSFSISTSNIREVTDSSSVDDPYLGADDPTLPMADSKARRSDQRFTGQTRLYPPVADVNPDDPALTAVPRGQTVARYKQVTGLDKKGRRVTRNVRVVSTNNFTGETVFAPDTELGGIDVVVIDD